MQSSTLSARQMASLRKAEKGRKCGPFSFRRINLLA